MKQTLAMLFVTALLLFSLAGCGEKKDSNTANGPSTGTTDNGAADSGKNGVIARSRVMAMKIRAPSVWQKPRCFLNCFSFFAPLLGFLKRITRTFDS